MQHLTDTTSTLNPQWWSDPWWEHSDYQHDSGLSLDQIRSAIDALTGLFDETWTRRAVEVGPPNAVIPILFGGTGLWPFQNLMWLAHIARAVSRFPTVHRPLRELIGSRTKATLFELEIAAWFVRQGWDIEFLKPCNDQRSPDIRIQKGALCSAIECKRFEAEQWEEWVSELSWTLIRRLQTHAPSDVPRFDIIFEPRIFDLVWDDAVVRKAILEEVAQRIEDAVRHALHSTSPTSISVPGLANIRFEPGTDRDGLHAIGGGEASLQAKMRRIVRNGILEAAQQLSLHAPGVVAISSDFTPPQPLVDSTLGGIVRADATLLQSVGAVVIAGSDASTVVWENPAWADHPVCRELRATLATVRGS
jgi:hypothetical protein